EEPFFIDLEQFFRILPDRKPSTGTLSALPDTATAGSFRSAAAAVDFTKGFNVLSIVVELPTAMLTAGGSAKLGIWGTISRGPPPTHYTTLTAYRGESQCPCIHSGAEDARWRWPARWRPSH